ncbi:hypothetical protein EMIT053CA3_120111 [Pseudomonas donghuensis]
MLPRAPQLSLGQPNAPPPTRSRLKPHAGGPIDAFKEWP